MAEYIKKLPVVDKLTTLENELQQYKPFRPCEATMYRRICDVEIEIGKMDAEDVAPVVHGKWLFVDNDGYWYNECSVCGGRTENHDGSPPDFNYCPNCGARIGLEEPNETKET